MSRKNNLPPPKSIQLRIGQLAKLLGITTKTIRHYHKLGLLPAADRSEKGYRLYSVADLYRLKLILHLKEVGFSLADIGEILQAENADAALIKQLEILAIELTAQIQEKKDKLQRVQTLLEENATLEYVERPAEESSQLHEMFLEVSPNYNMFVPEDAQRIDEQLLARLEAFNWGPEAWEYWMGIARTLSVDGTYLTTLNEHLQTAGHLAIGDLQLVEMALEIANLIKAREIFSEASGMDKPLQAAFQQVLSDFNFRIPQSSPDAAAGFDPQKSVSR